MTPVLWIILGCLIGLTMSSATFVWMMRHKMVVATRSERTFEETREALEAAVAAAKGWALPVDSWDLYERFRRKQLVPERFSRLKIYFLCNSALASRVLSTVPVMAGIMPCSWAVYELDDGSVWISRMNIGMMALLFGGVVGEMMREVEEADREFLTSATIRGRRQNQPYEDAAA